MLSASLSLTEAAARRWDVVVVGAGVAGGFAAHGLARRGLDVLLVDKAIFPRWKVCGCCLNPAALGVFAAAGLGERVDCCKPAPLRMMRLGVAGRHADLPLPGWKSLSRERLDATLAEAAVRSGTAFLPGTQAVLGPVLKEGRLLRLRQDGQEQDVTARLVLAADGLGGRLLGGEEGCEALVDPTSRVGAGVTVAGGPDCYAAGLLHMAYGRGGYVGLVRLEDGRLNVAAALDVGLLRTVHHPGAAAARLLAEVGWPVVPGLEQLPWRGTPALTRQRANPLAARVLAVGDAAGYLEPFTGEGIGWAAASAAAVVPLAAELVRMWNPRSARAWAAAQRRTVRRRQRLCRAITWLSRHPALARGVVELLARWPRLAAPLVGRMRAGTLS